MFKGRFFVLFFLIVSFPGVAAELLEPLLREIKKIASEHRSATIGLEFVRAGTGERVVSLNENAQLNPASAVKILTALAALDYLRPKYTFKTKILMSGEVKGRELRGNLYVASGGDPTFVTEKMYLMVDTILREGFRAVSGDIISDMSFFKMKGEESVRLFMENRAYSAAISPLVFNFNTTTIYVRPGRTLGDKLRVFVDPPNTYVRIVNKSITSSGEFSLHLEKGKNENAHEVYSISGAMPEHSEEKRFFRRIDRPALYFSTVLKDFMKTKGIDVKGKIRSGYVPGDARSVAKVESRPLSFIVKDLFTFSNNLLAENIVRTMGHRGNPSGNSKSTGIALIQKYASGKAGVPSNRIIIDSPSGLSRSNRITAAELNRVMIAGLKDFTIAAEFLNALCVAGKTGTLKDRFHSSLSGRIRAKTGSLNGVASLAGIYSGRHGEYVFTIMVNSKRSSYMTGLVDQLMKKIGDYL